MKPSDYIKKGWCQGASAKDDLDIVVHPSSTHARKWCLTGAICAAYPEEMEHRSRLYYKIEETTGLFIDSLVKWNDEKGRTQAQVLNLLESVGE